jgi:hypothetical protein
MNKADIVYQRLLNQRLSSSKLKRPVDVVQWLGAVQAQDFNGAKWAIAQRMRDATNTVIEGAYNEGKILRTHLMRPTWHFVAADDIRWLLQLTAPRVNIKCRSNYRKLELDDRIFKRCNKAFTRALKGGKHLTRTALRKVLNEVGVAAQDSVRLAHILLRAELDGVICSGPMAGHQFTYALLEERVPEMKALDRDEALAKLTRRYFTSHGPATLHDFIWWSGLTALDAKNGIASIERHLTKALCDDKVYWSPRSVETAHQPLRSAYLLPSFDEYIVAYRDRKAVFDLAESKLLITPNGILGPTVIVDGKVAGSWKHTKDKTTVTIDVKSFRQLSKLEKLAITMAADRYARFLGLSGCVVAHSPEGRRKRDSRKQEMTS